MNFLVTGGAGFIGRHIVEELVKQKHRVKIIDDLSAGKKESIKEALEKIKFVKGSITNLQLLKKELKGIDIVIHEAALISVPESFKSPASYYRVNVNGTFNVLEAARINNVKRVVFASSSSVYGDSKIPQKEAIEPKPKSPYAFTKLIGENYCRLYHKVYGLDAVILRYFNVYGPRQHNNAVSDFIRRVKNDKQPIIYGDGKQTRDFVHVSDVVKATVKACISKNLAGKIFNVGSGRHISIKKLAGLVNRA